jgi:S1-C subfamily serine protease
MTRMRPAGRILPVVMALFVASSGCGDHAGNVATSPTSATTDPANAQVAEAKSSVVKIRASGPDCEFMPNSGFVVAPNRVMSTAHAVAGADSVSVELDGTTYGAQVVSYDPDKDVSLLAVPNLRARPLAFADSPAADGVDVLLLGYPNGGPFTATPVRIKETIQLNGPNNDHTATVDREVYIIKSPQKLGDSGGPLIDVHGRVLGMPFGSANDDPQTGFAVTAKEVGPQMTKVANSAAVTTGNCPP